MEKTLTIILILTNLVTIGLWVRSFYLISETKKELQALKK